MSVSLLELSPLSSAPALTLSERGGARLDVRAGAVLDDAESTGCELAGAGLEGLGFWGPAFWELGFCAHAATQPPSIATKRKERMDLFYRPSWVARNDCRHLRAVSNSENRLPSCSMR